MKTETITLGSMPVYVARPEPEPARAVIVIQEAFGVNEHIEDVTRRFAAAGYLGVAPHLFHRTGGGTAPYDNWEAAMPHLSALSDEGVLDDVDASLRFLADEQIGSARTGIVGFCIGGRFTFLAAANRSLGAAVTFYGGGIVKGRSPAMPSLLDAISDMKTPWLGLFGDLDKSIPVDEVEQLRAALQKNAAVENEIVRYPNAGHGFHCDARPDAYEASSAEDGWTRTLTWFEKRLG